MEASSTKFGQIQTLKARDSRTSGEIQKEYAELCGAAGDKQYRVMELKAQLDTINQRLFALNKEFMALKENKEKVETLQHQEDAPAVEDTKTP